MTAPFDRFHGRATVVLAVVSAVFGVGAFTIDPGMINPALGIGTIAAVSAALWVWFRIDDRRRRTRP